MKNVTKTKWMPVLILAMALPVALAGAGETPTVEEQINGLTKMCTDTADARAQRQAEAALYDRLGGYDRIHQLAGEWVRLHGQNDAIKQMFTHIDAQNLSKHVADFVAAGTGGSQSYTGRAMPAAHSHLRLTDADFLAAGGDIVTGMQSMGYGQDEIDEIVCILVSLKDQVVLN
jgi:hemoglobin